MKKILVFGIDIDIYYNYIYFFIGFFIGEKLIYYVYLIGYKKCFLLGVIGFFLLRMGLSKFWMYFGILLIDRL